MINLSKEFGNQDTDELDKLFNQDPVEESEDINNSKSNGNSDKD